MKHAAVPVLGLLANLLMLITIFALGFIGGGDSQTESFMALGIAGVWLIASVVYVLVRKGPSRRSVAERITA